MHHRRLLIFGLGLFFGSILSRTEKWGYTVTIAGAALVLIALLWWLLAERRRKTKLAKDLGLDLKPKKPD